MSEKKSEDHENHVKRSKKLLEKAQELDSGDKKSDKGSYREMFDEIRGYLSKMRNKIDELEEEVSGKD